MFHTLSLILFIHSLIVTYDTYTEEDFKASASASSSSDTDVKVKVKPFSLSVKVTKTETKTSESSSSKETGKQYVVNAVMRIERYYASVKEDVSPLSNSASTLLENQDYVGFFKACGPNMVRGIRRAQEVSVYFKFKSTSKETAYAYSHSVRKVKTKVSLKGVKKNVEANSNSNSNKFKAINNSLVIKVYGFGLGLNEQGSETLIATTMEEHNELMKFAFKTMTQNKDPGQIGMVYGIEVYPWAHNVAFQAAAGVTNEIIQIPLPRSLIHRAVHPSAAAWANNDSAVRGAFKCKSTDLKKDKFGYCCEVDQLFDFVKKNYPGADADETTLVCRPQRAVEPTIIKDNLSNNGEFVARLDSAFRYRLNILATLENCISIANSISTTFDNYVIKPKDSVQYDSKIDNKITLKHLKMTLDPFGDYSFVQHISQEITEWVDMFYEPCYAALFGTNAGPTPDFDGSYFMAYPWYAHDECMQLTCLINNMRWDRKNGGCTYGMLGGDAASNYNTGDDGKCSKELDLYDNEVCKFRQDHLGLYRTQMFDCWTKVYTQTLRKIQPEFFITHYCLPEITPATATAFSATCTAPVYPA